VLAFYEDQPGLNLSFTEIGLAREVKDTCIWVTNNLGIVTEENMIKSVSDVRKVGEVIDKITEMLNPLCCAPKYFALGLTSVPPNGA